MNFASLPDGCGIMCAILSGAVMSARNACGERVDQRVVTQHAIDVVGGDDARRWHGRSRRPAGQRMAASRSSPARCASAGRHRAAHADRASASARRARIRHLCCLSQAAMPPTTTPRPTSTKISMNSGIFSAERRMRGIERIERDGDDLAVRHRERDDNDDQRDDDGGGDKLAHGYSFVPRTSGGERSEPERRSGAQEKCRAASIALLKSVFPQSDRASPDSTSRSSSSFKRAANASFCVRVRALRE